MNSKQQGDVGVAMAISYYTKKECVVSFPLTDNARYDLIIEKDGELKRVQCKTTNHIVASGVYEVQLGTSGGNRSWNGQVKKISKSECDLLFVYSFNGKLYEFPPEVFDNRRTISLGSKAVPFLIA